MARFLSGAGAVNGLQLDPLFFLGEMGSDRKGAEQQEAREGPWEAGGRNRWPRTHFPAAREAGGVQTADRPEGP
jgi:hypothetical protein